MSDDTARAIDAEIKALIDRNYERAETMLRDNIDILHSMKDCLMKYETIDAKQIDDLMARTTVRAPADWEDDADDKDNKPSGGANVDKQDDSKSDEATTKPNVGEPGDATS
jgi:cell division protease FtsH